MKYEPAAKRQQGGWVGTAKTVAKYTFAGVIDGVATIAGLVWSARPNQSINQVAIFNRSIGNDSFGHHLLCSDRL
jgi:hypothetical protein